MVELGQATSRIISMEKVVDLGEKGFRSDLIENSLATLKKEVTALIGHLNYSDKTTLIEDYRRIVRGMRWQGGRNDGGLGGLG